MCLLVCVSIVVRGRGGGASGGYKGCEEVRICALGYSSLLGNLCVYLCQDRFIPHLGVYIGFI